MRLIGTECIRLISRQLIYGTMRTPRAPDRWHRYVCVRVFVCVCFARCCSTGSLSSSVNSKRCSVFMTHVRHENKQRAVRDNTCAHTHLRRARVPPDANRIECYWRVRRIRRPIQRHSVLELRATRFRTRSRVKKNEKKQVQTTEPK